MKITNELKTYVQAPGANLKDAKVSFKVCNADFGSGFVKILIDDDKEFLVTEKELLAAVRNATNDGKLF